MSTKYKPAVAGQVERRVRPHTPGPWSVLPDEPDKAYIRIRSTRLGCRYKVANVCFPAFESAYEYERQESRGNAALIAAAPDLLAALQELRYACTDKAEAMADAAIAKALNVRPNVRANLPP